MEDGRAEPVAPPSVPGPLVDAGWLRANREAVHVVDCQYVLGDPDAGRTNYLRGHIPGAVFMSVRDDLAAPAGDGRQPLPDPEAFAAAARRAGIRQDRPVVAYDQSMVGGAARLWWLLRHIGKVDVAVLDGGLEAWGEPLASGEERAPAGDVVAHPRSDDLVDRDDVAARLRDPARTLVDTRAPARFRGDREPLDPVAGHIPGARNVPFDAPLPAELADTEGEIVAYCGSGISACVLLVRLAAAGRDDAQLYPGSWSDWASHDLPMATGDETAERVIGEL